MSESFRPINLHLSTSTLSVKEAFFHLDKCPGNFLFELIARLYVDTIGVMNVGTFRPFDDRLSQPVGSCIDPVTKTLSFRLLVAL